MQDPVRVISKIKNNRLLTLWEESGLPLGEFVDQLGISLGHWYDLVSLKKYPSEKIALRLSAATGLSIDELFPEYLKSVSKTVVSRTIPEHQMIALSEMNEVPLLEEAQTDDVFHGELEKAVNNALSTLSKREEQVLCLRYGLRGFKEHTFQQIADKWGVSRMVPYQVEMRALRKLRHFARVGILRPFAENRAGSDNEEGDSYEIS